ncbi:MAG: hypothetical protein CMJ76_12500 [Planctomycetaceae bacterium]|nr:hypothetical protein [Planctomycetaceae bacterium]
MKLIKQVLAVLMCVILLVTVKLQAAELGDKDQQAVDQMVSRAVQYLRTTGQADDGSFSKEASPAITSLVTTALLKSGRPLEDPMVAKALKFIESYVRADGGIHQDGSLYRNYETCLAILALVEANKDGRYDQVLAKANNFVRGIQVGADGEVVRSAPEWGGQGYGKHKRPDLSNTSFFIDALVAGGAAADDEAIQAALVFVSRTQNLESEHNTTEFATKIEDGGFYYTPAAGGTSQAGKAANGGLRSYASMTYAGLKSMIYAGVDKDDQRVQAAMSWIKKHYDLSENPGMGAEGHFYYLHTFAKTLQALEVDEVEDAKGNTHNWRSELISELARRQKRNGSWINTKSTRWLEADENLVTGYLLLSLSYCTD